MAGGYKTPSGGGLDVIVAEVRELWRRLRELERPTGTSLNSLVAQVQAALANINATVTAAIAANSYTKTQIDSKVANPPAGSNVTGNVSATGNVAASGNVTANGQVVSAGVVQSPGTKSNTVTIGYSAVYIDSAGNMGGNTSSRRFKTNISEVEYDLDGLLALLQYKFQRHTDVLEMGEAAPWQQGMMAEEVAAVAPAHVWLDEDGIVEGIRYEELVGPLIAALRRERSERLTFEAKVAAFLGPDFV